MLIWVYLFILRSSANSFVYWGLFRNRLWAVGTEALKTVLLCCVQVLAASAQLGRHSHPSKEFFSLVSSLVVHFAAGSQCCLSFVIKIICRAFQCGFNPSQDFKIMCFCHQLFNTAWKLLSSFQQHLQIFGLTFNCYYFCIKSGNRSSCLPIARQYLLLSWNLLHHNNPSKFRSTAIVSSILLECSSHYTLSVLVSKLVPPIQPNLHRPTRWIFNGLDTYLLPNCVKTGFY